MKFENPIMNISMFEVENVVTGSSDPETPETPVLPDAQAYSVTLAGDNAVKFTF